jgi:hypothetical protein
MAIFEEPLSAHFDTRGKEPCLILGFEHVSDDVGVMAIVCDADGVMGLAAPSSLIADWRYVEADERWYDLADLRARLEAPKEPVDEGS